jgi:phage shock protein PspC (stress-responsive transcriptional regulator)
MKAAISVELDGTSCSLDQDAFLALHAYLDRASARLGEHPDRDAVLEGLERSIGAKLARGGAQRSAPISGAEMAAALKEVGKVDGPRLGPAARDDRESLRGDGAWARPRRLYRLDEGKKIAGVCAGLAAYAGLDVGLVRAIVIVAAFFTGGVVFVGYVVLAMIVPLARTSTEIAAAHGALRSA